MTVEWLPQTPNPPRVPVFYTLTKIQKPTAVGRPIVARNDGPTERILAFVDSILQSIAKSQKSYLGDDRLCKFHRKDNPSRGHSLYTNIPKEEGINTVCRAYENFYGDNTPIPTQSLREFLRLILQENSFEFNNKNYSRSSRKRPPREFRKVVATRAGRLQEWALVSDHVIKQ